VEVQKVASYIFSNKTFIDFPATSATQRQADVKKLTELANLPAFVEMFYNMQPVHRFAGAVLEGISRLEMLIPRTFIETFFYLPQANVNDAQVQALLKASKIKLGRDVSKAEIKAALVNKAIAVHKADPSLGWVVKLDGVEIIDRAAAAAYVNNLNTVVQPDLDNFLEQITVVAKTLPGIAHLADEFLGTKDFVFSILGIHRNEGYGKMAMTLNPALLIDSQTWITLTAATTFNSGNNGLSASRPWIQQIPWNDRVTPEIDYKNAQYKFKTRKSLALLFASELLARYIAYNRESTKVYSDLLRPKLIAQIPPQPTIAPSTPSPDNLRTFMQIVSADQFGNHTLPEIHLAMFTTTNTTGLFMTEAARQASSLGPAAAVIEQFLNKLGANLFTASTDSALLQLIEDKRSAPKN
jgi:hypothetical protein